MRHVYNAPGYKSHLKLSPVIFEFTLDHLPPPDCPDCAIYATAQNAASWEWEEMERARSAREMREAVGDALPSA